MQHLLLIQTLSKLWIEGKFLNSVKSTHQKQYETAANIMLHGETECLALGSRTRQGCLLSSLLSNTLLEVLDKQQGKIKK
jgi:hypothetical protein